MSRRPASRSLSEQIAAFARRVDARAAAFRRFYALGITEELVRLSPVGDPSAWAGPPPPGYVGGQFKGNWQVSIGRPESGVLDRIDGEGTQTLAAAAASLAPVRPADRVYIVNNLPYARRLEYGWSQQAPAGMVRLTLARSRSIAAEALAQARRVQS